MKSVWSFAGLEAASRGVNWLLMATLPVIMLPGEFGVVALFVALETLLLSVVCVGQDRVVLKYYQPGDRNQSILYSSSLVSLAACLGIGVLVVGLIVLGKDVVFGLRTVPDGIFLAVALSFLVSYRLFVNVTRVEERSSLFAIFRLGFNVVKYVAIVGLAIAVATYYAYIAGLLIVSIVFGAYSITALTKRSTIKIRLDEIQKNLRFGWPFVFHVISAGLLIFLDRFMLEYFIDVAAVGIYSLGYVVGSSLIFVFASLAATYEPLIYRSVATPRCAEDSLGDFSIVSLVAGFGVAGFLLIVTPFLLPLLVDPAYMAALTIIPIIIAAHCIHPIYLQSNYRLTAYGRTSYLALTSLLALCANFGLNLILIPAYGLLGAALATYGSYVLLGGAAFIISTFATNTVVSTVRYKMVMIGAIVLSLMMIVTPSAIIGTMSLVGSVLGGAVLWKRGFSTGSEDRGRDSEDATRKFAISR